VEAALTLSCRFGSLLEISRRRFSFRTSLMYLYKWRSFASQRNGGKHSIKRNNRKKNHRTQKKNNNNNSHISAGSGKNFPCFLYLFHAIYTHWLREGRRGSMEQVIVSALDSIWFSAPATCCSLRSRCQFLYFISSSILSFPALCTTAINRKKKMIPLKAVKF
jgi:hypothetical protein